MAVIYHTTSSGASENWDLYNHIQSNVDAFLRNHPDALVLVTGDFNPTSTGFDVNRVKRLTGLSQMVAGQFAERHFAERHFAERHFAERTFCRRTFCRTDVLPNGHFAERTFYRTDSLPNGQFAENRDIF